MGADFILVTISLHKVLRYPSPRCMRLKYHLKICYSLHCSGWKDATHILVTSFFFFFAKASKICWFKKHVSERCLSACKHSLLQNTQTAWVYSRWGKCVGVFLSFCLQQPVTFSIKVLFLIGTQQWGFLKPIEERLTNFTWGSPSEIWADLL